MHMRTRGHAWSTGFAIAMRLLPLLLLTSCSRHPSCPQPLKPEPIVTVQREQMPCLLPPIPQPIALGGVPDGCHRRDKSLCEPGSKDCECDRYTITRDGLVLLAGYLAGTDNWMQAASKCLSAQQ